MKRKLTLIFLSCMLVCCTCGLIACGDNVHTHDLEKVEAVAATCETAGNREYYRCKGCDKLFADENYTPITAEETVIAALGHEEVHHDGKAATCTEDGWKAYDTCKRDGCEYTTYEKIEAGHDIEHHDGKSATCTEDGYEAYDSCKRDGCDYSTYKKIEALNHKNKVHHDGKNASCEEDGNVEYWACPDCKKNFSDENCLEEISDVVIPAKKHNPNDAVIENLVSATLESNGSYDSVVYCSLCGKELSRETIVLNKLNAIISANGNYRIEAENAAFVRGEGVDHDYGFENNANASGGQNLNKCEWFAGSTFTVYIDSKVETKAKFVLCCGSAGTTLSDIIEVSVNGSKITVPAEALNDWALVAIDVCEFDLKEGVNTVSITYVASTSLNLDYFEIQVNPIVSLEITGEFKKEYNVGESFNSTGLVVKASRLDGSVSDVSDYTINLTGSLTVNDTKLVVSYQGITAETAITVTKPATLTSISVSGDYKTEYWAGESFDTTGLIVTAHYDDGTSFVVDAYTIVEAYVGVGGTFVTVKYEECTAKIEGLTGKVHLTIDGTQEVNYIEAEDAAFVSGNATKSYTVVDDDKAHEGKRLDSCDWLAGSAFTISVNSTVATKVRIIVSTDGPGYVLQNVAKLSWNGKEQAFDVTPTGGWGSFAPYEIVEVDLTEGVNVLVWTLTSNQSVNYDYFEIQVNPIVSLEVSGEYKTDYKEGDRFDVTGMVVKAIRLDESKTEITDYTVTPDGELTVENTFVSISYAGITEQIEISVARTATLQSISVSGEYKTEYNAGEAFDTTGLIVTARFDDGSSKVVTAYSIVEEYVGVGETFVTVKYEECTAKIEGLTGNVHWTCDGTEAKKRIEMENATFVRGEGVDHDYGFENNANASGGQNLNRCDWFVGSTFTVSIDSKENAKAKLILCCGSAGSTLSDIVKISVNGNEITVPAEALNGWALVEIDIGEFDLREGANIIVMTYIASTSLNLDYFEIQIVE